MESQFPVRLPVGSGTAIRQLFKHLIIPRWVLLVAATPLAKLVLAHVVANDGRLSFTRDISGIADDLGITSSEVIRGYRELARKGIIEIVEELFIRGELRMIGVTLNQGVAQ